jgi:hypothetical protein
VHGGDARYANDPHWKDLVLFYEYFHGDSGRGVGANHQTGWTALVTRCMEDFDRQRAEEKRRDVTVRSSTKGNPPEMKDPSAKKSSRRRVRISTNNGHN